MNHQPFETWLVDEVTITPEQETALQAHLEVCPHCRQIKTGWQAARSSLQTAPLVRPAPGFSQRFSATLAERRAREIHRRQIRRLILGLTLGLVISIGLLGGIIFSVASPVDLMVKGAGAVTGILSGFIRIEHLLFSALQQPWVLGIWILATSGISILVVGWMITLWRISSQGVQKS
jgi:anti-sigma factor RsiW